MEQPVKAKPKKMKLGEKGGVWGKQGFGGYPGLKYTAQEVVEYIPIKPIYVEPFAGLGRTAALIKNYDTMILNDMGDYAVSELRKKFKHNPRVSISQLQFKTCIEMNDSEDTVNLIDPPWITSVYTENNLTFCDRTAGEYYDELLDEILPNIKGDWILCSSVEGPGASRIKKSHFPNHEVRSKKPSIFGEHARTLMASNKPFIKHRQQNSSIGDWI